VPVDVAPDRFEELVADALDSIPPELGRYIDNVAVFVDNDSPPGGLYGLYQGIPLTNREAYGGLVMPDRITIFRQTICCSCMTEAAVVDQVRKTVVHEVAHHFGIGDERLRELGYG
jgi:predicted Zn-dependent protease with MMP-like domain